jgi:hypothetical protein
MSDTLGPPTQEAFLLQSQINPFPVSGQLELTDQSLRFTLDKDSGQLTTLGWLEKELAIDGLRDRLKAGDPIQAFDLERDKLQISWPKQFMGSAMKVSNPGTREWIVSLILPSGSLYSTYKTFKYRSVFKAWKAELGE